MSKKEKKEIVFDDEQPVIIHDELAEIEVDDPTFGGMREGARLEETYPRVLKQLRRLHMDRFRHSAPTDPLELFNELADEVHFAGEEELRLLVEKGKANKGFTGEEEERILPAVEQLFEGVEELEFSE